MNMSTIPSRTAARLAATLLAATLLAMPAAAQTGPGPTPSFGERLDVRVINLEVVVTAEGERVDGLGPQDFTLLVDGREAPVEYFTEVRNGRAVAGGEAPEDFALPALAPGEAVGTRYLVFIDDYFTIPSYRNRVLADLAEQLPQMSADDAMAIIAFDGTEVEMLSSWTRSLAELEAALDAATRRRAYGLQRESEQRIFESSYRGRGLRGSRFASAAYGGFRSLDGLERQRALELATQVERVADAAASALRAFARPPGRKVMLLYSGGWPADISSWVAGTFEPVFDDALLRDWRPFAPLVETANRLGYTLYPVDVNGLDRGALGSAEYGSAVAARLAADRGLRREQLEEDTLFDLATATGGRAFVDGAGHEALEGAIEDTRSYYWLGFTPAWQENDEQHRVEVEVKGKGLKVRARDGFSDLSRGRELTMLVDAAQLFDLPLAGAELLAVHLGEPSGAGLRKVLLPVRIEIPLAGLTLAEGGAAPTALELRIAATDSRGDRAETSMVPLALTGTGPSAAGQVAIFETGLKLRRQPHHLLFSIFDPASGQMLSKRVEVSL